MILHLLSKQADRNRQVQKKDLEDKLEREKKRLLFRFNENQHEAAGANELAEKLIKCLVRRAIAELESYTEE